MTKVKLLNKMALFSAILTVSALSITRDEPLITAATGSAVTGAIRTVTGPAKALTYTLKNIWDASHSVLVSLKSAVGEDYYNSLSDLEKAAYSAGSVAGILGLFSIVPNVSPALGYGAGVVSTFDWLSTGLGSRSRSNELKGGLLLPTLASSAIGGLSHSLIAPLKHFSSALQTTIHYADALADHGYSSEFERYYNNLPMGAKLAYYVGYIGTIAFGLLKTGALAAGMAKFNAMLASGARGPMPARMPTPSAPPGGMLTY